MAAGMYLEHYLDSKIVLMRDLDTRTKGETLTQI
uniref:Uncharacterized protein n=1 Tax=Oncorhynchus mykiss TaxID=8022 RepID=A0A8C7UWR1_ONCMY